MERPLLSLTIGCFNQQRFIREAVEGALAQTYSPLEIIISDDASQDETVAVAEKVVESYPGPHLVRINRNPVNLGIGGNLTRAVELCRGELIVMGAGDDVSVPGRVEAIYQAWEASNRRAACLFSRFREMDDQGRFTDREESCSAMPPAVFEETTVPRFLRWRRPHVPGCANAVARRLFTELGPLPKALTYEDTALAFRTVLLGGVFASIQAPLVHYRRHGGNITFGLDKVRVDSRSMFDEVTQKRRVELERFLQLYDLFEADIQVAHQRGVINAHAFGQARRALVFESRRFALKIEMLSQSWPRRLRAFGRLYASSFRPREMLSQMGYLLPKNVQAHVGVAAGRFLRRTGQLL